MVFGVTKLLSERKISRHALVTRYHWTRLFLVAKSITSLENDIEGERE